MHCLAVFALCIGLMGSASAATLQPRDGPKVDISFTKFDLDDCSYHSDNHKLESGDCKTMDEPFQSYFYGDYTSKLRPWHHNDFDDPRCAVVVYPEEDCHGLGMTMGSLAEGEILGCTATPWLAKSVYVTCGGVLAGSETVPDSDELPPEPDN